VDATARLLEINLLHMLEAENVLSEAAEWQPLLEITGYKSLFEKLHPGEEIGGLRMIEFMTQERANPGSIRNSLRVARENARVVRDRISKEMWECVNEVWLRTDSRLAASPLALERAPDVYRYLRSEVGRFHGLTVSTMMRGEAFGFYLLGFFLERCDMTARILDVKYHLLLPDSTRVGSPLDYYQWAALLKSMSGFEAYRRKYHGGPRPLDVAEFVIFDSDFPRSLRFGVDRMAQALAAVGTPGPDSQCARAISALTDQLAKHSAESVFQQGLHEFLYELLGRISALNAALQEEFFEAHLGESACFS
jgi:uncharacterized alpha-E superfamily protein